MKGLWRWMLKAGFSILDQGLVSVSNFGLSVVLARLLPAPEYGAFALEFNIFLVISGFHNALLVEPMSVLGPARHMHDMQAYLRRTVWLHAALMSLPAAGGLAIGIFLWNNPLGPPLSAMSIGCLPVLLFWLLRRAHYLETRPASAAASSAVYLITLLIGGSLLWRFGRLSAAGGFWVMSAAGLAASIFSLNRLRIGIWPGLASTRGSLALAREDWGFGRWILPSALLYPLLSQVQLFFTGAYLGLGAAGVFRALQNPILPVMQVVTALSTLALPGLAREFRPGGASATFRRGIAYTAAMTLVAIGYEIIVLSTGNLWDRLLYTGRYSEYDWLMPVLGLLPIASAVATGLSVVFRAIQRPELVTIMHVVGGIFGVATAYFIIRRWNLAGAVYGMVAAQAITAAVSIVLILMIHDREPRSNRMTSVGAAVE